MLQSFVSVTVIIVIQVCNRDEDSYICLLLMIKAHVVTLHKSLQRMYMESVNLVCSSWL